MFLTLPPTMIGDEAMYHLIEEGESLGKGDPMTYDTPINYIRTEEFIVNARKKATRCRHF